jgi:hypothetical protein
VTTLLVRPATQSSWRWGTAAGGSARSVDDGVGSSQLPRRQIRSPLQSVSFEQPVRRGGGTLSFSGSTQMHESLAHWVAVVGLCCMPRETSPLLEHSCRHSAAVMVAHPLAEMSVTTRRNAFGEAQPNVIGFDCNTRRDVERVPLSVASEVLRRLAEAERRRDSFAIETTLSSTMYARRKRSWKAWGYQVTLHFIELPSEDFRRATCRDARRGKRKLSTRARRKAPVSPRCGALRAGLQDHCRRVVSLVQRRRGTSPLPARGEINQ